MRNTNLIQNSEEQFIEQLLELQYGVADLGKARKIADGIPWARGWPEDKQAFWNAEAFMWSRKIPKDIRHAIKEELSFLSGRNLNKKINLDLGCGAYSYIPSICFDFSEKMLQFNDRCNEKIVGDLEKALPFPSARFDSVTAIFVLNYVKNHSLLFSEIYRILRVDGVFVMILSACGVNDWQRQKEANSFSPERWCSALEEAKFKVSSKERNNLSIFVCRKSMCIARSGRSSRCEGISTGAHTLTSDARNEKTISFLHKK